MPVPCKKKPHRHNASHKSQALPAKFKAGFLASLDGRTDIAKALRQNYNEIVQDIGGTDDLSHIKASLVERFCYLEAMLQTIEHEMVSGQIDKTEAIGRWIQAVNSLSGLAKVLGVDRKRSTQPWLVTSPAEGEVTDAQR